MAIQVLVVFTVLLGFAAFTIDVGTLFRARAELQSAADSAALAAASAYTTDRMLQVRLGGSVTSAFPDVLSTATDRAHWFAGLNNTLGSPTLVEMSDIVTGSIDTESASAQVNPGAAPDDHNAVQVIVRRENDEGQRSNGPVEFSFAPIFGKNFAETSAFAVAVFNDRFSGFDSQAPGGAGALPFSVHEDVFWNGFTSGTEDNYGYDADFQVINAGPDGISEINLYPYDIVPGNFGLLNIGSPNQGVPGLTDQIENGIPADDFEAEIGTSVLTFYNEDGSPNSYPMTGDPGMRSVLESALEQRVGEVVAFFLHDVVTSNGSNSVYQITNMRFGRVMAVQLNGAPTDRGVWIQPVVYDGAGVRISGNAGPSDGFVGRVVLVR